MAMNVITTADKVQRDAIYKDLRENGDEFEKQAVKFSSARRKDGTIGEEWESTYSVAYPIAVSEGWHPNHGSARNPRKFPGRKVTS